MTVWAGKCELCMGESGNAHSSKKKIFAGLSQRAGALFIVQENIWSPTGNGVLLQ